MLQQLQWHLFALLMQWWHEQADTVITRSECEWETSPRLLWNYKNSTLDSSTHINDGEAGAVLLQQLLKALFLGVACTYHLFGKAGAESECDPGELWLKHALFLCLNASGTTWSWFGSRKTNLQECRVLYAFTTKSRGGKVDFSGVLGTRVGFCCCNEWWWCSRDRDVAPTCCPLHL